jgi:hypothetical protein
MTKAQPAVFSAGTDPEMLPNWKLKANEFPATV